MKNLGPFIFCCLAFCTFYATGSSQSVPVLLWSTENTLSGLPDVDGVNTVQESLFYDNYLKPLATELSENAVIFLQDKLHVDDFTKYADVYSLESEGGAFKNIKRLMEENFSLELPNVMSPHGAVDKLRNSFHGDVHSVISLGELENLNLKASKPFLLIVHLTPVGGAKDEEKTIEKNDAMIGQVTDHLNKRSIKYSAMFTAKSAHTDVAKVENLHKSRQLMAVELENKNGTFLNISNNIYIYIRTFNVRVRGKHGELDFSMIPTMDQVNGTHRDNDSGIIEFAFIDQEPANDTEKYTVKFVANVNKTQDRWIMYNFLLTVKGAKTNVSLTDGKLNPGDVDLVIPILYSFHCTDWKLSLDKNYSSYQGTYVQLTGFQIQPFNIQKYRFFNAQDCVPYFTTGIWMGWFSASFLIAILLFGTVMILNLSIMDRYDDPKGKTIIVNVTEKD